MRKIRWTLLRTMLVVAMSGLTSTLVRASDDPVPIAPKEWTFLVYLNGHNSLDNFAIGNLRDMEKVGSTERVNVVVQWASYKNPSTQRLYVQKQNNPASTTLASTVVESLPTVDMGDWHSLVDFVKWGAKNYPAQHYFVDVWDHGGGWHVKDISWDDRTGHVIKTEELGTALREIANAIGHKVDVYGSDACLMAMAEVAGEMKDSVDTFVGSQEVEPGAGWPYDTTLSRWNSLAAATPSAVARVLAQAYVESYSGGSNGTSNATMSVYDMAKIDDFEAAAKNFATMLAGLDSNVLAKTQTLARAAQSFAYADYVDLVDFATRLAVAPEFAGRAEPGAILRAAKEFTTFNAATSSFKGANGLSIWLPTSSYDRTQFMARYTGLQFDKTTGWSAFLKKMP